MTEEFIDKIPESDVVISSRVRLARNIDCIPFPQRMNPEQGMKVVAKVKESIAGISDPLVKNMVFVDIRKLSPIDRQVLVEKHIISPDLNDNHMDRAVIISRDEKISIMINEEDHLRLQCIVPGMQLDNAWQLCRRFDEVLEEKLDFAFDGSLGYLTCCPTNIGTGIRASVMLHLPGLSMSGYLKSVLEACGKLGIAVRGMYGENSEASGNMFQISNQVALGQTEEEIIKSINDIALQIVEQERILRSELHKQNPCRFEDRVFRSLGTLRSARILSTEESHRLLSDVRLGVDMKIIKDIDMKTLNEIMLFIQPAFLQKLTGKTLAHDERDIRRAELVRDKLIHL